MKRIEVPYLVVGAGPVGLTGAILLANQDRETLVLERRSGPQTAPAAHVVNARSFEICRQAGLDMDAIADACSDPDDAGLAVFMTHLTGEILGSLPFEQQGDDCLRHTPTPLRNLSQHDFEPILVAAIEKRPAATLRYGQQWESAEQDDEGVTSVVLDRETGERYEVRSRFLLGIDGAGSRVRKAIGVEMDGPPQLQSFLMIHFEANLRDRVADRKGVLYWMMDPEIGGTLVAHDLDRDWVYMHNLDPSKESIDDYDDARCRSLVLRAIGEDSDVRILHRGSWVMSAQVAQAMRRGRIFLAGDAAHRFPPTGGLGLNSGFQDVHGLIWKLCAVEDGWAPESVLDSYEQERRPVAQNNADQSLRNAMKIIQVPQALGVLEEPTSEKMRATLADPAGRAAVEEAIENQAEHFDMLGLQIGFQYEGGMVVPDGSAPPAVANPVREYVASSRPGARLPHAWLQRGAERISSLDLIPADSFVLISQGEHEHWATAAAAVEALPIQHLRMGVDVEDSEGHWGEVCGLEPGGAVLVRPDQHVAFRAQEPGSDPAASLQGVAATLLAP